jgi:hypothetical protein
MNTQESTELMNFFKILADADRLKIAGLLANEDLTLTQIAEKLGIRPAEAGAALGGLESQGLIQRQGNLYHLAARNIEQKARAVLAQSFPKPDADRFEGEAYDKKVLSDYITPSRALRSIPSQQKKLLVILRHLQKQFQPEKRYPEKEVNEILRRYHEDYAALRRYLVDYKLMDRNGREYWVV